MSEPLFRYRVKIKAKFPLRHLAPDRAEITVELSARSEGAALSRAVLAMPTGHVDVEDATVEKIGGPT